jgi:hypothetical protein
MRLYSIRQPQYSQLPERASPTSVIPPQVRHWILLIDRNFLFLDHLADGVNDFFLFTACSIILNYAFHPVALFVIQITFDFQPFITYHTDRKNTATAGLNIKALKPPDRPLASFGLGKINKVTDKYTYNAQNKTQTLKSKHSFHKSCIKK